MLDEAEWVVGVPMTYVLELFLEIPNISVMVAIAIGEKIVETTGLFPFFG